MVLAENVGVRGHKPPQTPLGQKRCAENPIELEPSRHNRGARTIAVIKGERSTSELSTGGTEQTPPKTMTTKAGRAGPSAAPPARISPSGSRWRRGERRRVSPSAEAPCNFDQLQSGRRTGPLHTDLRLVPAAYISRDRPTAV